MKEVSQQSQELLRQALEDAQAELRRKFEVICEIRAIESLPHVRVKNFDDTEVSERNERRDFRFVHVADPLSHVRLQATSCWERCPWRS